MKTTSFDGDESRRRRKGTPATDLLHLDLVVHVRVPPLNFVDLRLLDELEGEPLGVALPRDLVDGRVVARAEFSEELEMFRRRRAARLVPLLFYEISQFFERFSFLLSSVIIIRWQVLKGFVEAAVGRVVLLVVT